MWQQTSDQAPDIETRFAHHNTAHLMMAMRFPAGSGSSVTSVGPLLLESIYRYALAARLTATRIATNYATFEAIVEDDPWGEGPESPWPDDLPTPPSAEDEASCVRYEEELSSVLTERERLMAGLPERGERKMRALEETRALLLHDLQGFFGTWAMVRRAVLRLAAAFDADNISIPDLAALIDRHHVRDYKAAPASTFGRYVEGRDWLEHIDERLPGSDQEKKRLAPFRTPILPGNPGFHLLLTGGKDFVWLIFSLEGTGFRMGSRHWDVGEAAVAMLDEFARELDGVLRAYVLDRFRVDPIT